MERSTKPSLPVVLPFDVLIEILKLLPAESLVRFKSVCKSWNELIHNDYFVRSHLEHWRRRPMILPEKDIRCVAKPRVLLLSLDFENQRVTARGHKLLLDECLFGAFPRLQKQARADARRHVCAAIVDSCDGLLLLRVRHKYCISGRSWQYLLVCNPITKSHVLLPPPPTDDPFMELRDFRWKIACDSTSTHKYKVIGIQSHTTRTVSKPNMRCLIFDLHQGKHRNTAAWKELSADSPWNDCYADLVKPVMSAGAKMHWIVRLWKPNEKKGTALVSLEIPTESLRITKILMDGNVPVWSFRDYIYWYYSDRTVCCGRVIPESGDLEVWVVEDFEHPVWRKLDVIKNPKAGLYFRHATHIEDGGCRSVMMFRGNRGLLVYDMNSREWNRVVPLDTSITCPNDFSIEGYNSHINSLVRCD